MGKKFLPSDIFFNGRFTFGGSMFGNFETECMAAFIVRYLQLNGNSWDSFSKYDFEKWLDSQRESSILDIPRKVRLFFFHFVNKWIVKMERPEKLQYEYGGLLKPNRDFMKESYILEKDGQLTVKENFLRVVSSFANCGQI